MIQLTTKVDKNLRPVKYFWQGKMLRTRLEGEDRQDVCRKIITDRSRFSREAFNVARHIKNAGGKINVSIALKMIEIQNQ